LRSGPPKPGSAGVSPATPRLEIEQALLKTWIVVLMMRTAVSILRTATLTTESGPLAARTGIPHAGQLPRRTSIGFPTVGAAILNVGAMILPIRIIA